MSCVPLTQVLPWQQPPGQLAALHPSTHAPAWQTLPPAEQLVHAAPFRPQAVLPSPGLTHTSPTQQPAQLPGPQAGRASQRRVAALHWVLFGQVEQLLPPPPHAVLSMPGKQVLPWQQPPRQFCALQVGVPTQRPPMPGGPTSQRCPCAWQSLHCAPPRPHERASRPGKQRAPLQHPLGQVSALQAVPPHWRVRVSHSRPLAEHEAQVRPPVPQAESSVPARQTSRPFCTVQQPLGHVRASQPVTVLPHALVVGSHVSNASAAQLLHVRPRPPQRTRSVPERHTPFSSQQPDGHVVGPQRVPLSP
jgi:hypothetical protein